MALTDVFHDTSYRTLTEDMLRASLGAAGVDVSSVRFADDTRRDHYSWLSFVIDPGPGDHVAPLTKKSAVDHIEMASPNGILQAVKPASSLSITVFELEISDEAPINMRGDDGKPVLYNPLMAGLGVARAVFRYAAVSHPAAGH
jgi:hypothetical protein